MPTNPNNATTPTQVLAGLVRKNLGVKSVIDIWYYVVPVELKAQLKLDHHEEFRDWILEHVIPKEVRGRESQYGLSAKEEFLPKLFDIAVSEECPYVSLCEYPPGTIDQSVVYGLHFTDFANCCKLLKHKNEASLSRKLSKCKLVKVEGSSKDKWRFNDEKGTNVARLLLKLQHPPNVGRPLSPHAPQVQPEAARPVDPRGQTTPVTTNYATAVLPSVSPPTVSASPAAGGVDEDNDAFMASLQQQQQQQQLHKTHGLVEPPTNIPFVIPREVVSKAPQQTPPPLPLGQAGATQMKNSERSLGSLDFGMPTHDVDVDNADVLRGSLVSEIGGNRASSEALAQAQSEDVEADPMDLDDEGEGVEVDPALLRHSRSGAPRRQKSSTSIPSFVGRSSNSMMSSNLGSFLGKEKSNNSISIQSDLVWEREQSGISISTFDLPQGEDPSRVAAPNSETMMNKTDTSAVGVSDDVPDIDDEIPAEVEPVLEDFEFSDDEDDANGKVARSNNILPMRVGSENGLQPPPSNKRQREEGEGENKPPSHAKFFVVPLEDDDLGSDIVPEDAEDFSQDGSAVIAFAADANEDEKEDHTSRDAAEVRSMWLRERGIPGSVMFSSVVVFVATVCVFASRSMNDDDTSSALAGSDVSTSGTDDRESTPDFTPTDELPVYDDSSEDPGRTDESIDGSDAPDLVPPSDVGLANVTDASPDDSTGIKEYKEEAAEKSGNGVLIFFMCLSLLTMAICVAYLCMLRVRRRRAARRAAQSSGNGAAARAKTGVAIPKTEDTVSARPKTDDFV